MLIWQLIRKVVALQGLGILLQTYYGPVSEDEILLEYRHCRVDYWCFHCFLYCRAYQALDVSFLLI